ncbi:MAG: hypothetical protein WBG70_17570 [Spirulinaceae cyanobacterium]
MNQGLIKDPFFRELQFDSRWIKAGIISSANFEFIKKEYITGDDKNTEHYRWGAFQKFMQANSFIHQETFYTLYQIGKNDPDYSMGRAIVFDIIKRLDCPEKIIDMAIDDQDKVLAKYALKCKNIRENT